MQGGENMQILIYMHSPLLLQLNLSCRHPDIMNVLKQVDFVSFPKGDIRIIEKKICGFIFPQFVLYNPLCSR